MIVCVRERKSELVRERESYRERDREREKGRERERKREHRCSWMYSRSRRSAPRRRSASLFLPTPCYSVRLINVWFMKCYTGSKFAVHSS